MEAAVSPYVQILAISPDTFPYDLECHLRHGYVISSPEYFLMARSVSPFWPLESLRNPALVDPEGDCWWIWAAAGEWRKAAVQGMASHGIKTWIGFDRRDRARMVEMRRLLQMSGDNGSGQTG